MREIEFIPCHWEEIQSLVEGYLNSNRIVVESFWEEHVLGSNHYKMVCDSKTVGYFAIHKSETIVLFHVNSQYANQSQTLFAKVKKYEKVTNAMVVTGDEFLLSHCIDAYSKIEKQAYFAVYPETDIPLKHKMFLELRPADIGKDIEILRLSGDFLDDEIGKMQRGMKQLAIYIAEREKNVVGFGVIEYGRVVKDIASIGMYVCEQYRRQGVAANILQQLKHIAQGRGCRAFSGCWYYNHNSKKSMESAGAYSKTRLVRFYF